MNQDILEGKWKQVKGEVKNFWGKLTDDDVTRLDGSSEKLAGVLQERYGYTKDEAHKEITQFLNHVDRKLDTTPYKQ